MGNNVFANGRELACKSGQGKVIAAFPDVCFTPPDKVPPTPPGVPIPYPLTSMASDTNDGTKSVIISNKEVMLRDSSNFKKCTGDDAAQTAKKGMISSKITGKVYFTSWSMDVKIQKKNAVRHFDTMTSNHSSPNANAALPWPYLDQMALDRPNHPCHETAKKVKKECSEGKGEDGQPLVKTHKKSGRTNESATSKAMCGKKECREALNCVLQEHKSNKASNRCCSGKTTHHLVPSSSFIPHAARGSTDPVTNYNDVGAPCLCVKGKDHNDPTTEHGKVGRLYSRLETKEKASGKLVNFGRAIEMGAQSATVLGCPKDCIEAQLKHGHRKMKLKVKENDPLPRQ